MSSYEIEPAGVQAVVNAVQAEAAELMQGIDTEALEGQVMDVAGVPAPGVASALGEFLGNEAPVIESIGNRIMASLAGVATVAQAYGTADDEMLQTIQGHAVDAAESGDFSYFADA
ncbi:DUF6507 family protein [Microbacterium arborescens]|uniref:DUF6507 family protein n=1 Tax=Microbacterium arborescens TaxID=33883 RepID=UPI0027858A95|nr:DUF6507 family protein [Microbacterium arborescens]MDQ1215382.1 hypothetical protein [Microbacterium arborescens]